MPKRTINTRRNKAAATGSEIIDNAVAAAIAVNPDSEAEHIAAAAADIDNRAPDAVVADIIKAVYGPHEALPDATPDAAPETPDAAPDAAPVAAPETPDAAPVAAAPVAAPDAKAAFLERKALATTSAVSLYPGASLAVHRSDRQPADSKYLERVASPVQKIGPNGPTARDNSFILAVYDYLATYFGGDYSVGFNPANFGADLGTTSRAASVGYLALTDSGTDIVLTPAGITRGANLAAKRAKA